MPSFQELARLYRGAAVPSSGQSFMLKLQYGQCNSQANEGSRHIRETDITSFQLNTFILALNNSPERNDICFYVPHHLLLQLLVYWTSKKQGFVSARYLRHITNLIQNIYFSSKKSVKYELLFIGCGKDRYYHYKHTFKAVKKIIHSRF